MKKITPIITGFILIFCLIIAKVEFSQGQQDGNDFRLTANASQSVYQNGVPHTDRMGRLLMKYDPESSFLPICLYHTLTGEHHGRLYSLAPIKQAGFNCVHTWEGQNLASVIEDAKQNNLQIIYHGTNYSGPTDEELQKYKNDATILAWYLREEPTGVYWGRNMETQFSEFQKRIQEIKKIDNIHPVFIIDTSTITPPQRTWWLRWNSAGDISSHDNYRIGPGITSISASTGIPETVSLAVEINNQKKPVWFVPQSFELFSPHSKYHLSMPNSREERAMIYASIIHGSTGIIYFALDSFVTRDGNVIGIAENTAKDYSDRRNVGFTASEGQRNMSQLLWDEVVRVNQELTELKPIILSPTSPENYKVYVQGHSYTDSPVRSILKEVSGELTLLTVNLDKRPLRVKYEFPRSILGLQTLFEEGRNVAEMKDKFWVDTYEEFGVHIYKFKLK
ncbi:hypothetical protein NG796_09970 [Laspinema sp. A4]|uniref:hypothetical protein n=1 Tax=Laspinema sp. D2d TaxID=2953686 RepID=UPI0021BAC346|nr:hypothetical protein [Laspinema sp. D2d]MCT7983624.1 hypothetical protein [Laspinema sp. D2d]